MKLVGPFGPAKAAQWWWKRLEKVGGKNQRTDQNMLKFCINILSSFLFCQSKQIIIPVPEHLPLCSRVSFKQTGLIYTCAQCSCVCVQVHFCLFADLYALLWQWCRFSSQKVSAEISARTFVASTSHLSRLSLTVLRLDLFTTRSFAAGRVRQ